ncbi:ABC transporter ATP-binding protein [Myxococcota bacterium]|nr:ABC transporter ATP-binding protein [Myxococcota bacterium]
MSSSPALAVKGLKKRYGWRSGVWALDDMSFEVPRGALCALIGPNGAGKTTLFSVICGFLPPDEGSVDVLGLGGFAPAIHKGRVGVLPQDAALPERHTARGFLRFMGELQGLSAAEAREAAERAILSVDLGARADHTILTLSHGMRRRLATASALLGKPELVLLDEPTAGLDPVQAHGLREHLRKQKGLATLVISSHNLTELEQICDYAVILDKGRVVMAGPMAELTAQARRVRWRLSAAPPLEALRAALPDHELSVQAVEGGVELLELPPAGVDPDASSIALMRILAEAGIGVRELRRGQSLEESVLAGRS